MPPRSLRQTIKTTARRVVPCRYVVWSGRSAGQQVALTFDDGPHPEHTPPILAALREAGARATFFVLGSHIEKYPEIVAEMIADGHELGNHTYSHVNLGKIDWRRGCEELQMTDRLLRRVSSGRPLLSAYGGLFRPPWGKIGLGGAISCVRSGCRAALWSVDSEDYRQDGVQPLIERVTSARVKAGDILLFHDDNASTVEALAPLLRFLTGHGLSFATISELVGKASPQAAGTLAVG